MAIVMGVSHVSMKVAMPEQKLLAFSESLSVAWSVNPCLLSSMFFDKLHQSPPVTEMQLSCGLLQHRRSLF